MSITTKNTILNDTHNAINTLRLDISLMETDDHATHMMKQRTLAILETAKLATRGAFHTIN